MGWSVTPRRQSRTARPSFCSVPTARFVELHLTIGTGFREVRGLTAPLIPSLFRLRFASLHQSPCLRRVVKSANILVGVRVGNYDQLTPVHLTPTANVTVSEFHEVDGTVELRTPSLGADRSLICVNLHKRTGADEGEEGVVFEADIAIYGFAQVQMLQETNGDLVPLLHNSGKEIRFLQAELRLEPHWQRHFLDLKIGSSIQEMRFRNSDESTIAAQITNRQAEIGEQFCDFSIVDCTERMELIDARGELAVFDVRHPSVGNVIFPVMPIRRDLLALLLHIACSQSKADAQFLQPLSGTRTRLMR